jgi:hypothetical protein
MRVAQALCLEALVKDASDSTYRLASELCAIRQRNTTCRGVVLTYPAGWCRRAKSNTLQGQVRMCTPYKPRDSCCSDAFKAAS